MEKDDIIRSLIMTQTDLMEILKSQKNKLENTKWDPETKKWDDQSSVMSSEQHHQHLPHKPPPTGKQQLHHENHKQIPQRSKE